MMVISVPPFALHCHVAYYMVGYEEMSIQMQNAEVQHSVDCYLLFYYSFLRGIINNH